LRPWPAALTARQQTAQRPAWGSDGEWRRVALAMGVSKLVINAGRTRTKTWQVG
jgi:hypothetical protein